MKKNILLLSWSDNKGGAAQSCYEIYKCLKKKNKNVDLFVQEKILKDKKIISYKKKTFNFLIRKFFHLFFYLLFYFFRKKNDISLNLINSDIPKLVNINNYDIINIHWIGQETLSIMDLGLIKTKVVLTLHDMWAFSGIEHYPEILCNKFFYNSKNYKYNLLSFLIWNLKKKFWKRPLHVIVPSKWLYKMLKQSRLMRNWPAKVIPYPVDQKIFKIINKKEPIKKILKILYVASGRLFDYRKGFDLLEESLLKYYNEAYIVYIVGTIKEKDLRKIKINFKSIGYVSSKKKLAKIYNSMDILALPSRQDNLPNVGLEAHSCGLPIIAFDVGGIPEIVAHKKTGYIAKKFDLADYSKGINFIKNSHSFLRDNAERRSKLWNPRIISLKYSKFLKTIVNENKNF